MLGQAVVPLCLVLIGVSLAHYGVRFALAARYRALGSSSILHPPSCSRSPAAWACRPAAVDRGHDGGVAGRQQRALFAQRYRSLQAETSTATVVSTLAFVASAPLWLAVLHFLG